MKWSTAGTIQAICVTADRKLEVRDVPAPNTLIDMQAVAINHGNNPFLTNPGAAGSRATDRMYDIRDASAAGVVRATGAGLPSEL